MYRLTLLGLLLVTVTLAGCQNLQGPRAHRADPTPVDAPYLPPEEQERRIRDRLALPETSAKVAPRTMSELPGPTGR